MPKAVDYEISTSDPWNYLLCVDEAKDEAWLTFDASRSSGWNIKSAFSETEFPFSVTVSAKILHTWGWWNGSKITADLPPSPVKGGAADGSCTTTLRLVPYGSTNLRISVFPWA